MILAPSDKKTRFSFLFFFPCSNNQAEYEALKIGLELLTDLRASAVEVY